MKKCIKKNKESGFTLVELLAVIVILAIILVIAVPKIMNTIKDATKASLESSAKMVAAQVENQYTVAQTLGKEFGDTGSCMEEWAGLNETDYESCTYEITSSGEAKVTIKGAGKFKDLNVCNATRSSASAIEWKCKTIVPVLNCTYDGQLVQGAELIHKQYTYRYMQEYNWDIMMENLGWQNIEQDGWGVILTDKTSTDPINTPICTYINGKPIVSTSAMFFDENGNGDWIYTQAEIIDVSSWNTSTVINMSSMFDFVGYESETIDIIGLENLDTSSVTNMSSMFSDSGIKSLNLSNFDTSNVTNMSNMFYNSAVESLDLSNFNTSNVTNMNFMFSRSATESIDLSSFDTSKVKNMSNMFSNSKAKTIYVGDNWNTSMLSSSYYMFGGATNLVGGNGTIYNSNYIDKTYARVDKEEEPGYFTYKAGN